MALLMKSGPQEHPILGSSSYGAYAGISLDSFLTGSTDFVLEEPYVSASPVAGFYSTTWDVIIPMGDLLFSMIIFLQQKFGGCCFLPPKLRELGDKKLSLPHRRLLPCSIDPNWPLLCPHRRLLLHIAFSSRIAVSPRPLLHRLKERPQNLLLHIAFSSFTSLAQSPLPTFSNSPSLNSSKTFLKRTHTLFLNAHTTHLTRLRTTRPPLHVCFSGRPGNPKPDFNFGPGSFVLTGLVEAAAGPDLGFSIQDLSLDEKAEFLLVAQGVTTAAIVGVLYTVASTFQPLPQDIYRYGDICEVVDHVGGRYPEANLYAVGWSLGANILVRYLGQESDTCRLSGAVSLCNPFNLVIADEDFHKGFNNVYDKALSYALYYDCSYTWSSVYCSLRCTEASTHPRFALRKRKRGGSVAEALGSVRKRDSEKRGFWKRSGSLRFRYGSA
ncbi:hypothetical protein ACLB2K_025754 [Fragaria x ananassa]